jgi:ABC-type multidrug transport system ATPase subunit
MTQNGNPRVEPSLATAAAPEPAPAVALARVEVRYGTLVPALAGLDLSVARGEWLAVEGGFASGKSVLLRLASGRERPASGTVRIVGEDPFTLKAAARRHLRRSVGVMAGDLPLFAREDAISNVALVEWLRDTPAPQARERAQTALAKVGLDPRRFEGEPCARLSSGEQRLVALARALAHRPSLLVLDDLLDDLDADRAARVLEVIDAFREGGVTVVCSARVPSAEGAAPAWPARVRRIFLQEGKVLLPGSAPDSAPGPAGGEARP